MKHFFGYRVFLIVAVLIAAGWCGVDPVGAFQTDRALYEWLTEEDRAFSWYDGANSPVDIEFWATSPADLSGLVVLKACYIVPPYGMLCDALGQTHPFRVRSGDIAVEGLTLTVGHNGDLRVLQPGIDPVYLYDEIEADDVE